MGKVSQVRRKLSAEFKLKVALSAVREDSTIVELSKKYEVHPTLISDWKKQLITKGHLVFSGEKKEARREDSAAFIALQAKIGELTMAVDFLKKKLPR